ncbi:hypothetical protein MIND_00052800 [Mycena indigotica]|uniref:Mid2 domain-containing protein n=1 Tax=Mycena indigotica TaxID=2126181 RepID=A0A8H6TEN4_9AGAR|nr:uncharacterized protein MIND_00052800 [Mycena indigotica]KAF7315382.1 hypothetical protein MIND_00052800 [Mycena indigotica]
MRPIHFLLPLIALARAQSNAVTPHSVTQVPIPQNPVSAHPVSSAPIASNTDVSAHPVSMVSRPAESAVDVPYTLSWSSTIIPRPTETGNHGANNKGKIAGGVVGGLAVVFAVLGTCLFVRLRRRSTQHWRNRTNGHWQDQEGKPDGGPVYVGNSFGRDVKAPSPTTAAPLFIREPRLQRGHTRDDTMEMTASPTRNQF